LCEGLRDVIVSDPRLGDPNDEADVDALMIRLANTDRVTRLVALYDPGETKA
jgi:hypothetical protein